MSPTEGPPPQLSPAPHGVPHQMHFLSWFRVKTLCVTLNKQHVLYMIIVNTNLRKLADSFFLHVEPFLLRWCCLYSDSVKPSTVAFVSVERCPVPSVTHPDTEFIIITNAAVVWIYVMTRSGNSAQTSCRTSALSLQRYKLLNWTNWFMV